MSISDKLTYLNDTKNLIKTAIENKGVTVGNIPFRDYKDKIAAIPFSNQIQMPSPVSGGIDYLQYGVDKVDLYWKNPKDGVVFGQKLVYKKNAIPSLPIVDTSIDLSSEISTQRISGLEENSTYGVWILTFDENGVIQTSKNDGNTSWFKTQSTLGTWVEVSFPSEWSSWTINVIRSDTGDVFASATSYLFPGIWKLNFATLEFEKVSENGSAILYAVSTHDDKVILSSSVNNSSQGGIYLWDGLSMKYYNYGLGSYNYSISLKTTTKTYVSASGNNSVYIWDGVTMSHVVNATAINPIKFFTIGSEVFCISASYGVYRIVNDVWTLVSSAMKSSTNLTIFTTSTGISFISSSSTGIFMWNGTTFTSVYGLYGSFNRWIETPNGSVYCASTANGIGLLKWNGTTFVVDIASLGGTVTFEFKVHSSGIYLFSGTTAYKVYKYDGTNFVSMSAARNQVLPYVDQNDVLWTVDDNTTPGGIHYYNGSTFVMITHANLGSAYDISDEDDTYLYLCSATSGSTTAFQFRINKTTKVLEQLSLYYLGVEVIPGYYQNGAIANGLLIPNGMLNTTKSYAVSSVVYSENRLFVSLKSSDNTKFLVNK